MTGWSVPAPDTLRMDLCNFTGGLAPPIPSIGVRIYTFG